MIHPLAELTQQYRRSIELKRSKARLEARLQRQRQKAARQVVAVADEVESDSKAEQAPEEGAGPVDASASASVLLPPCPPVQFLSEARRLGGIVPPKRRKAARVQPERPSWVEPGELTACPFSKDKPCCRKSNTRCYEYFGGEVDAWRQRFLYNSTLSQEELADRLRQHRVDSAGKMPGEAKPYCVVFQKWWVGGVHNRVLFPRSHAAGNQRRRCTVKTQTKQSTSSKDVSVMSWFIALKPLLECMPDKQEYHVAAPFMGTVHKWYEKDCASYPTVYLSCSKKYFLRLWREYYPEVKLRKVLRFTKCEMCERLRQVCWSKGTSSAERADARAQLEDHYKYVKVERAGAIARANDAVLRPAHALSIALDGTSQLPRGIPQFAHTVHGDESSLNRLHHHFTLAVVHGMGTKCFITRDNIASDPNLTVECLQRTLAWAEDQRGGRLPPKLYLQVDNCWRENKNSLVVNWLSSLVERGMFPDGIYLSFLPVGHTHNEVDQVASRISVAVRGRDVTTPEQLFECLDEAIDDLHVTVMQHVADTKEFLNPGKNDSWTHSRFKRIQNVSEYRFFRVSVNVLGHVQVVTKQCETSPWSRPFFPIKGQGDEFAAGGVPERVPQAQGYGVSAVKPINRQYRQEVRAALRVIKPRVSDLEWSRLQLLYKEIFYSEPVPFHWARGGEFRTEAHLRRVEEGESDEDASDDEEIVVEAARGVFQHWDQVEKHRANPEPSSLRVGNIVCVWLEARDVRPRSKHVEAPGSVLGFRLGRIVGVCRDSQTVDVHYYDTSAKTLTGATVYRPVLLPQGQLAGADGVMARVDAGQCFFTFACLTGTGRVRSAHVRCILYLVKCRTASLEVAGSDEELRQGEFDHEDLSEYMEDLVSREKTCKKKTRKRGKKRKRKGERARAVADEEAVGCADEVGDESTDEVGDEDAASCVGGDETEGGSESEVDPAELTSAYFDDKCQGERGCECDFEALLVPGVPHCVVAGVFNHNRNRAADAGDVWSSDVRGAEYTRLEGLTLAKRGGRARRK